MSGTVKIAPRFVMPGDMSTADGCYTAGEL
jgi:hypothetical protein